MVPAALKTDPRAVAAPSYRRWSASPPCLCSTRQSRGWRCEYPRKYAGGRISSSPRGPGPRSGGDLLACGQRQSLDCQRDAKHPMPVVGIDDLEGQEIGTGEATRRRVVQRQTLHLHGIAGGKPAGRRPPGRSAHGPARQRRAGSAAPRQSRGDRIARTSAFIRRGGWHGYRKYGYLKCHPASAALVSCKRSQSSGNALLSPLPARCNAPLLPG